MSACDVLPLPRLLVALSRPATYSPLMRHLLCAACMQYLAAESDAEFLPSTANILTYDAGPALMEVLKSAGSLSGPQSAKVLERTVFTSFADACNRLLANGSVMAAIQVQSFPVQ